jgi:hypothetical protein
MVMVRKVSGTSNTDIRADMFSGAEYLKHLMERNIDGSCACRISR